MSAFDRDTGRDRYFEARERELEALVPTRRVDCPVCGSAEHEALFVKHGFTFVRCTSCAVVFVNPQLEEELVLDEYRTAATNDLWFDVLMSERQQELDRAKFAEVLDALEPYRGEHALKPVVREFAVRVPNLDAAIKTAREAGINPGYPLRRDYPEFADGLLVAITERRTRADIDRLVGVLSNVRQEVHA